MKWVRSREDMQCAVGIVASGIGAFTGFYLCGLHVWAWAGLGLIPFCFGCWGLSQVLPGSRVREICANLTVSEREQAAAMARAYGRRLALWLFLGMALPVALLGFGLTRLQD